MQSMPPIFVADAPALDFLNSIATPVDVQVEWLADGDGLLSWLQQAQWVPNPIVEQLRARSTRIELDRVAGKARELREWFRDFVQKQKGRPLARDSLKRLEPLNRLLERDDSFCQVVPAARHDDSVLALQAQRRWRSADTLLLPIAENLARFICTEDFEHVKACEGPTCTLLFADHTRGRARRWCSMAICGNRAKQAAHRQRQREIR